MVTAQRTHGAEPPDLIDVRSLIASADEIAGHPLHPFARYRLLLVIFANHGFAKCARLEYFDDDSIRSAEHE